MSNVFKQMQSRQIQRRANNFIKSLEGKSERYVEHAYLDNKEFENNEIVLSYIFFKYPSLIKILPVKFQISRINSNLDMFHNASEEVKRKVVSMWLKDNKLFMNANVVMFDPEELTGYIKLYFKQPEDITKLYMDDIRRVITVLSESDLKETENVLSKIKDKLNDKQWEYVIEANPIFIKYASQEIQNKYADDEKYNKYINGEARQKYVEKQFEKIQDDISILYTMSIDIQKEYIKKFPYMINYLDEKTLIELLKYDIELIKYVNMPNLKNDTDKTQEVIYRIMDNIENKPLNEVVDIFVNKCVLTAKGKLYRYDNSSNNMSYQYTKRALKLIQSLSLNQISALINIDTNYSIAYVVPVYNDDSERSVKEKVAMDANARCLKLFKHYYGDELYDKYYKVINKIYVEYISNIDRYDYSKDYSSIFEIFKVLFNKEIIKKNNYQKVTIFIGMSLLYKSSGKTGSKVATVKLLNEMINTDYDVEVKNDKDIYDINTLEIYDKRFDFIDKDLLMDFDRFNFVNMSSLLLLVKSDKARDYFIKYYNIVSKIYTNNKETLYRCIENFGYYSSILSDIKNENLSEEEKVNLLVLLSTFGNHLNINRRSDLLGYNLISIKKLVEELYAVKDINVYKNVLANFLFCKGYDENGNYGWLDISNIKEYISLYDYDIIEELEIDGNRVFSDDEVALFCMMKLLFSTDDLTILLAFIENVINKKLVRNTLPIIEFFNKLKKYRREIINEQVVTLDDIEMLYIDRPNIVKKEEKDGINIYTIRNQDFKVLCSEKDDGVHYLCENASKLQKNYYGYDRINDKRSCRFTIDESLVKIKMNKDSLVKDDMKPKFIIVVSDITDDLISIAKTKDLSIIKVSKEW